MKKTRIVFVEASLEPVPRKLWNHPSVESDSKRRRRHPSKILLYIPIHYTAMKDHGISTVKRGRPDIVHRLLIMTLDSPLCKGGLLEIYIHTLDDKIIWVNPDMRVPLDYYRFEGLMIQLLRKGRVPPEKEPILMKIIDSKLEDVFREKNRKVYLLSVEGEPIDIRKTIEILGETIVIGAFQEGEFREEIASYSDMRISISPYNHHASTAACNILTYMYMALKETPK
jgi:rRNA small subunit pseudouridine methyltransferase Nep1